MSSYKIEIVAEVANAHQGDPETALKIASAAADAGADAVKFQLYSGPELLVRSHPRFEHFSKQAFSESEWEQIFAPLKARGVKIYADVFGLEAMKIAAGSDIAGVKIHSSDLANLPLLEAAAGWGRLILLATGGSTAREINTALDIVADAQRRPMLLHGFQAYPTAVEDSELNRLVWLKETYGARADIGYMDHVAGDDSYSTTLPAMAIAMGAQMIEKHVTLNRAAEGIDYYSSIDVPQDFSRFVIDMRRAEEALGNVEPRFSVSENHYRVTVKKHWVTTRVLAKGHILGKDDLVMKRVHEQGSEPVEMDKLLGRALLEDVEEETPITRAHVACSVWALVVARFASSRLPGKALIDIAGGPALGHLFERLKQASSIDRIIFCTTTAGEDGPLTALAGEHNIDCYRGPVEDVLGRMLGAIEGKSADIILRVTGDDILVDPDYVNSAVDHHLATNAEYTDLKALPSGTEVEVFDAALLRTIWAAARDRNGTEYLTSYVVENRDQFRVTYAPVAPQHSHDWRLTLDTAEDLAVVSGLLDAMRSKGKALDYRLDDIVAYFGENPDALEANSQVRQRQTPIEVDVGLNWSKVR